MDEMLPSAFFDVITVNCRFAWKYVFSITIPSFLIDCFNCYWYPVLSWFSQPVVAITYPISIRHIRQTPAILLKNSSRRQAPRSHQLVYFFYIL